MAHAAVVSLMHTLEQIHQHPNPHLNPYTQQEIDCLSKKLSFLLDFLEENSQNRSKHVLSMVIKIRDVAYRAEDVLESRICYTVLSQSGSHGHESSLQHLLPVLMISDSDPHIDSQKIIKEFDSIMEEVVKIADLQKNITEIDTLMEGAMKITEGIRQSGHFLPSRPEPSGQSTPVGFEVDLKQVRDRLCYGSSGLQIVPIVGMGGIGKTTLSRNVYDDSYVAYHFHIRAWVTLSPQYHKRELFLSLLDHFVVLTGEIRKESDEKLADRLYKSLKGRRYLIVIDDIWSTTAWDNIKFLFPNDNIGSRIIVTTRITDVAGHASLSTKHHQMHFLNEEQSWNLFLEKVFGQENCPPELEDIGRTIAKNCQGLPLTIVVIGGLLSNSSKTRDYWEYVAENLSSIIAEKDDQCLKILTLSFKHLPTHLKACFLYMGVFPENYEIPISRLIKLWAAEGFLKPKNLKHLDEIAEEYLMELISRNLLLVCRKGSNGKIKSCGIHNLLREFCVRVAHKENFFCVKSRYLHFVPEEATFMRRLSIHDDALYSRNEEDMTLQSVSHVRSFIYSGWDETQLHSYYYFGCLLLRVLDMVGLELTKFPDEILQLVNLRYIAITCLDKIPPSITLLSNLQTLVVEDPCGIAIELPGEIFNMRQLRHIIISRASLPPVFSIPFPDSDKHFVLENLETLSMVQDLGMTKHVLEKMPNVKKLGIHYNTTIWHVYDVHLQKLETLKIVFDSPTNSTFLWSFTSASGLKKITLERGRIGWEDMTFFGSLPNLEVLKLREFAFIGPVWVPIEGEFPKLKFLHIWETDLEHWRADRTHFPRLEHLILWKCSKLVEIPPSIGEIETLQIIETDYSSPSVVKSAKDILDDKQSQGDEGFQVLFHPTKARLNPLKFGLWQDDSGVIHRPKRKLDMLRQEASPAVQNVESLQQRAFPTAQNVEWSQQGASPTVQNVESSQAFDVRNSSPNHNRQSTPQPLPQTSSHASQPNPSIESVSVELGGSGWSGDGEVAAARAGVGLDNLPPRLQRPQVVWTPQLHNRFVDTVAHLGIQNAVPRTILQLMSVDGLTIENVASHLMKYKLFLKRLQGVSSNFRGGVGGDNVSVDPTNHLMATLPPPVHFSNPGGQFSNHFLPFGPVAAMQQHHQMTAELKLAFDVRNSSPNHNHQSTPQPLPQTSSQASQPNPSIESESDELGGSGWSGDGGVAAARVGVGLDNLAPRLRRPQVVWTPQLHNRFVDAVAHLGIQNAVPRTILQLMSVDGLTIENVASHLMKYKLFLKRSQGVSSNCRGGVGGDNVSVDPTNHLMATLSPPVHFSNPGGQFSNHFLPFGPVAAMQQHHQMTAELKLAFDVRNSSPNHNHQSTPQPLPQTSSQASQPNPSIESESDELGGSGWSGDGGVAAARVGVGLDNLAPRLRRPQVVWTPQLHNRFVDAVAHLGIQNAVPRTILQLMSVDGLTIENVASHLMKYKLFLKRSQGVSSNCRGGVGGDNVSVDPTNHLMATLPPPVHFSNPGGQFSNHFLPFGSVAAMQQHHQMTAEVGPGLRPGLDPSHYPQLQQQFRSFGSSPPNEHPFIRQSHQQVQSVGVPVHSSNGSVVSPLSVEDLESPGRGVHITLFPTRDDSS
ncbi:late blight resistance homolog R1B-17 [Olea europaea subsp. europaea]|uniref:Late blight resistance homolog R1B-17 n=1 Tax=Olea europaea subsp. europaea TaxID=158383 RepID=A0A8S0RXQ3_OLEEU|nr:late blight resistance homolog R1B-17 [Olea europaea subsp. europaea]